MFFHRKSKPQIRVYNYLVLSTVNRLTYYHFDRLRYELRTVKVVRCLHRNLKVLKFVSHLNSIAHAAQGLGAQVIDHGFQRLIVRRAVGFALVVDCQLPIRAGAFFQNGMDAVDLLA